MTNTTVIFDEMTTDAFTMTTSAFDEVTYFIGASSSAPFTWEATWDSEPILPKIDTDKLTAAAAAAKTKIDQMIVNMEATSFTLATWQKEAIAKHFAKGITVTPTYITAEGVPIPRTPAEARDVSREELLAAFRAVVGRLGEDHRAASHSTNVAVEGSRCIQGEVMLELGFGEDCRLPAAADGVATLLGLQGDRTAYSVLEMAEMRNDMSFTWGEILTQVELTLAA